MLKVNLERVIIEMVRKEINTTKFFKEMGFSFGYFKRRCKEGKRFNNNTLVKVSKLLDLDITEFTLFEK